MMGFVVGSGAVGSVVLSAAAKQNAEPIKAQGKKTMILISSIDLGLHDILRTYHHYSINMCNIYIRQRPAGTAATYITSNNIPIAQTLCDNIVNQMEPSMVTVHERWPRSVTNDFECTQF